MKFSETSIPGVFVVDIEPVHDMRGYFSRVWCAEQFESVGLSSRIHQVNTAYSKSAGTLRGMHFQVAPHDEAKFITCTQGAIFDVALDLREDSPTFLRWHGEELTPETYRSLYVPPGCAHGYLTLRDHTFLTYSTSRRYEPAAARGIRYDDPMFGIEWPADVRVISAIDRAWPDFSRAERSQT